MLLTGWVEGAKYVGRDRAVYGIDPPIAVKDRRVVGSMVWTLLLEYRSSPFLSFQVLVRVALNHVLQLAVAELVE